MEQAISLYDVGQKHVADGCTAYGFVSIAAGGKLGAIPLKDAVGWSADIKIRQGVGKHGPELYLDVPAKDAYMPETTHFTVILGDHEGQQVVFTWHPGDPLPPFDGVTLTKWTAVKVHNG